MTIAGRTKPAPAWGACVAVSSPCHLMCIPTCISNARRARDPTIRTSPTSPEFLPTPVSNESGTDYQSAAKFRRITPICDGRVAAAVLPSQQTSEGRVV